MFVANMGRVAAAPTLFNSMLRCRKGFCGIKAMERRMGSAGIRSSDFCLLALTTITGRLGEENLTRSGMFLTMKLPLAEFKTRGGSFVGCLAGGGHMDFGCRGRPCRVRVSSITMFPRYCTTMISGVPTVTGGALVMSVND